jgi:hypothetical protein
MPSWDHRTKGVSDLMQSLPDEPTPGEFETMRDAVAAVFKGHSLYERHEEYNLCVDNVADAEDVDDFNSVMSDLYDVADHIRMWIG